MASERRGLPEGDPLGAAGLGAEPVPLPVFDAFAYDLTGPIGRRGQSASIRTGRIVSRIDGDMWGDAPCKQGIDESARVITLVATDALGPKALTALPLNERQGGFRGQSTESRDDENPLIIQFAYIVLNQAAARLSRRVGNNEITPPLPSKLACMPPAARSSVAATPCSL